MSAIDYLKDPLTRAAIVKRRVVRGRKYLRKRGTPSHPSAQFMVAHGFAPDECTTQAELDAQWEVERLLNPDPPPYPNPASKDELARLWVEATQGLSHDKSAA